jgi:16S rRNA (cytidine1402-2'-O)-methyltransferase
MPQPVSKTPDSGGFSINGHRMRAPGLEDGLYLVSTPIGHLKDITIRALETLAGATLIACEDTRVSRVLLSHYGIDTPVLAYHEHNADVAGQKILNALQAGPVALVSDAGTPLVSDPGGRLVAQVLEAGHRVFPVPGASAALAALVAAGLGDSQFQFVGFLPPKEKARSDMLRTLAGSDATLIFYESPKRIAACLANAASVMGDDRPAVIGRELTKRFETFYRGTLGELAESFAQSETPKGEIVLLIGRGVPRETQFDLDNALLDRMTKVPLKQAVDEVTGMSGLKRRDIYQRALQLRDAQ